MTDFDILWKAYPHAPKRKTKRAVAEATFNACTGPGKTTKVNGLPITSKATPAVYIAAAKARHMELLNAATPADGPSYDFEPGICVWLNQAGYQDYEPKERDRLAGEYDDLQERMQERKHRLEIVR